MQPSPATSSKHFVRFVRGGADAATACAIRLVLALIAALCFGAAATAGESLHANGVMIAGDASRARVLIQFDREPAIKWFLLRNPHRLVIDLPETHFDVDDELAPRGLVNAIRYGNLDSGVSRIIVAVDGPFRVERIDITENEASPGYRLVADIVAGTEGEFESALAEQIAATGSTVSTLKSERVSQTQDDDRFTIVVDPGHGGIDDGAKGVTGTLEKSITLAFSLELAKALRDSGRYDVHLTRDSDLFLRLGERVQIARQHGADLFISVHADTIRHKFMRGATVYTVSDKASDPVAAAKAIRENLADQMAGIEIEKEANQEVANILVDLIRRETQSFSLRFARSLVGELTANVEMVNNPHRFAGFRVLKAPDVPSVLLELGYLSNVKDEAQLRDPEWRALAISSITAAIDRFAGMTTSGAGG